MTTTLERREIRAELMLLRDLRCEFTQIALTMPPDLPQERYEEVANAILRVGRGSQWWIGDALNYGDRRWGEGYKRMLDLTGYDRGTLHNIASVCRRVEVSRRRETLSFTHHVEIADLEPEEQVKFLERADYNGWSSRELRDAVTSYRREQEESLSSPPSPPLQAFFDPETESGRFPSPPEKPAQSDTFPDVPYWRAALQNAYFSVQSKGVHNVEAQTLVALSDAGIVARKDVAAVLIDGRLYLAISGVTKSAVTGERHVEAFGVKDRAWWETQSPMPSPLLALSDWQDEISAGTRPPGDVRGLVVGAYVLTGERQMFWCPRLAWLHYEGGEPVSDVSKPEPEIGKSAGNTEADDVSPVASTTVLGDASSWAGTLAARAVEQEAPPMYAATMLDPCPHCHREDCDDTCDGAVAVAQKTLLTITDETPALAEEILRAFGSRMTRALGIGALDRLMPLDQSDVDPDESEVGEYWGTVLSRLLQAFHDEAERAHLLQMKLSHGVLVEGDTHTTLLELAKRRQTKPDEYLRMLIERAAEQAGISAVGALEASRERLPVEKQLFYGSTHHGTHYFHLDQADRLRRVDQCDHAAKLEDALLDPTLQKAVRQRIEARLRRLGK